MEAKKSRLSVETSVLECSVCFEIRRNGRIFMCVNGHNICSVCKAGQAGNPDAAAAAVALTLCPECRVPYGDPLIRNLPIEKLIRESDLEFGCDNDSNCYFADTVPEMEKHDRVHCAYRMVPCTEAGCGEMVKVKDLGQHMEDNHKKCRYAGNGCNFTGKLVPKHELYDCEHMLRICWVNACHKTVKVKDQKQHLEEWHKKCRYAEDGCCFPAGKRALVIEHEKRCKWRKVPCPGGSCNQHLRLVHVMDHLKLDHKLPSVRIVGNNSIFSCDTQLKDEWLLSTYNAKLEWCTISENQTVVRRLRRSAVEGTFYSWIKIMGSQEEAVKFTVVIKAHGNKAKFEKKCKVYPVDMGEMLIMSDLDCFQISLNQVKQCLVRDPKDGYAGKINFEYLLQKK